MALSDDTVHKLHVTIGAVGVMLEAGDDHVGLAFRGSMLARKSVASVRIFPIL